MTRGTGLFFLLALLAGLVHAPAVLAVTCTTVNAIGNWNAPATWTGCTGGNGTPANTPGTNDDVIIANFARTYTVTANAAAKSITFTGGGQTTLLRINSGITLNVGTGGVTINTPTGGKTKQIFLNTSAVFSVSGNVTLNGTSGNNALIFLQSNAATTVTITGNLTANGPGEGVTFAGAGTLNIGGNFTSGGILSAGSGTVVYNGSGPGSVGSYAYYNLTVNKTTPAGIATTGAGAVTVPAAGALRVDGGTLNLAGTTVAVTGTTTVSGNLNITSTTGTKTFTGAVTINNGGTWDNSAVNEDVAMGGSLTNNGTFTSGTGIYTFTGNANWAGSNALTFSGNVVANSNTRTNAMTNVATTIVGNLSGTGAVANGANQTLRIGGNATLATLTATAVPNTVEYNGTAAQIAEGAAYHHLVVSNSFGPGAVTLSGANTSIAGDLTTNGNFDPLAGNPTVTFNGTAAQSLLGTATNTTFYNLTISNTAAAVSRKLTTNGDVTVNNQLVFTSGRIVPSGTFKVVIPASGLISGAAGSPDNRFVAGHLQKFVPNGNPNITFEVGTDGAAEPAIGYSPVAMAMTNVAGLGGSFIVYATINDHPQIATSTLDDTKSVNRWWALTTTGVTGTPLGAFTSFDATFTFINVSPSPTDVDAGANPGVFEIERWDGAAWNVMVVGTRTSTSTQVLPVTVLGEFAVAEKKAGGSPAGGFNAMDTTTCAIIGFIKTKVSGIATSLNIVALNSTKTAVLTNYNNTVRVELMNAANATGFPDANGCGPNWTVIQQLPDVSFSNPDNGCKATASFTENNAYRNVRVRITESPGKPAEKIACSGDNFAIRPQNLTVTAHDATWETAGTARALANAGASGGIVHKASTSAAATPRPFTLRAAPVPASATNYDGNPTTVSGFPACGGLCATPGTLTYTAGSWTNAGGGIRENATANYSEAGTFNLRLEDTAFAAVDASDSTPDSCSNTSPFGRRVCSAASVGIGRFVPDHFDVAPNTPPQFQTFGAACAGTRSFTYIGQSFGYDTVPIALVTARNAGGGATLNYRDTLALWKITTAAPSDVTQTYSNNAVGPSLDVSLATNAPTVTSMNDGTGTVTINSLDRIFYTRSTTTPDVPFNANISLTVSVRDDSEADGEITTSTATPFSAIGFDSGNEFRFGRLRVANANGSNLLPLMLRMETQHWIAPGYFITNTDDNCTAVATANVGLGNFKPAASSSFASGDTTPTIAPGPFVNGIKLVKLSAPGGTKTGSVDVVVQLEAPPGAINSCLIFGTLSPAPSTANLPFLRGKWCAAATGFDRDPTARARFGVYRGADEFIDLRENFIN